jgi:hypothetical protein
MGAKIPEGYGLISLKIQEYTNIAGGGHLGIALPTECMEGKGCDEALGQLHSPVVTKDLDPGKSKESHDFIGDEHVF